MSVTSWIDDRIAVAVERAIPLLIAQDGPLIAAVTNAVSAEINSLASSIPTQMTTAIEATMVNLPTEIAKALKGILPWPL